MCECQRREVKRQDKTGSYLSVPKGMVLKTECRKAKR
jgi:hypothetical protein